MLLRAIHSDRLASLSESCTSISVFKESTAQVHLYLIGSRFTFQLVKKDFLLLWFSHVHPEEHLRKASKCGGLFFEGELTGGEAEGPLVLAENREQETRTEGSCSTNSSGKTLNNPWFTPLIKPKPGSSSIMHAGWGTRDRKGRSRKPCSTRPAPARPICMTIQSLEDNFSRVLTCRSERESNRC